MNALDPIAHATRQQRLASDPAISAFVSASAGSGKTKLLIDRLLRLMLPGPDRAPTPPERILCLTFTKAGAAEMAIRLRHRLGAWVIASDAKLDGDLRALDLPATAAMRDHARALFARILDIPGGLRIGTIHAFCEQLLRRFPLEAAVSPYFRLVDEADTKGALDRAREATVGLAGAASTVAALAARLDALGHGRITRALLARADRLAHAHTLDPAALAALLGRALDVAHTDAAALIAQAADGHAPSLAASLRTLAAEGTATMAERAHALLDWLGAPLPERCARWNAWRDLLLKDDGEPRSVAASTTRFAKTHPGILAAIEAEARRVAGIEGHRNALALVDATASLLAISGPSLAAYESEKRALGLLDFDDLIARSRDLLAEPGVAWVLFKLDGGLDHLLLDEVQDTSAAQWAIAGKLTEEFFAGDSAAPSKRTIFAVGDFKQSIYSFQGADPLGFHAWRETFRARAAASGRPFREPSLNVSFRSSPAILRFVDAVFAGNGDGVAETGAPVPPHASAQPDLAGQVELWPLAAGDEDEQPVSPWLAPDRNRGLASGEQRLAEALAAHLARLVGSGELRAGEILVLVRRRTRFAGSLMRALKALDVPVAGLDRIVLTAQPAVQDLLALCDALLLPDDDLAFATMLTSPLGDLDDPSLMALALDRPGALWAAVQARSDERPDWRAAHDFFAGLLARADYVSPHALLAEALGARGGRARFLRRLGPEAAEAIDELLAASLAHARDHVPSLQGFAQWVRQSGAEIKREAAEAAGEIRLMTVHGSKGLEARLVVLADTTALPRIDENLLWSEQDGHHVPIWVPGRDLRCPPVERLREAERRRALDEANRLLYVALTRARQRLIVCGWQPRGELDGTWYAHCSRAMDAMDAIDGVDTIRFDPPIEGGTWHGEHRIFRHPGREPTTHPRDTPIHAAMPGWAGRAPDWHARPPPAEPMPRRSLTPSRPDGVAFGPVPPAVSPRADAGRAARRRRGDVLHALLQHLPSLPAHERAAAARRFGRRLDGDVEALVAEALAIIGHPALATVFGPLGRAEQRLAGLVGDVAVSGVVDRIAIGSDFVDLVDFKSGRAAPADPARTPVRYLRQMSAYRGVLQSLRPASAVRCALVWTADAIVMPLPGALLDAHAPALATELA